MNFVNQHTILKFIHAKDEEDEKDQHEREVNGLCYVFHTSGDWTVRHLMVPANARQWSRLKCKVGTCFTILTFKVYIF